MSIQVTPFCCPILGTCKTYNDNTNKQLPKRDHFDSVHQMTGCCDAVKNASQQQHWRYLGISPSNGHFK